MLLYIFQYLPKKALIRCSLVNRRFHDVSMDEYLWTRIDVSNRTIKSGAMGRIISRGILVMRASQTKASTSHTHIENSQLLIVLN